MEILEYCDRENILKREQYYIDKLNPEYNLYKIAGSPLGRKPSEATKLKISKSLTGLKASEITKEKIKVAHSESTKAKLKVHLLKLNSIKRNNIKVSVLDLESKLTTEYLSIREAAKGMKSYADKILKYEKLQLEKGYIKPFKNKYVIVIHRKKS